MSPSPPRRATPVLLFCLALLLLPSGVAPQEEVPSPAAGVRNGPVRVYLDCPGWLCDFDYVRRQLPFVTWVRDRQVADVHLLVTEEDTGGGGNRFTLDFIGRGPFEELERRLTFSSDPTQTEAEERRELVRTMALGLVNYAAGTDAARSLRVVYEGPEEEDRGPVQIDDPWDRWVFDVDLGGEMDSESRVTSFSVDGGLSANRTTPEWKFDAAVGGEYGERRFDVGEDEDFVSVQRTFGLATVLVKSLGPHWSVGGQGMVRHSSRLNQNLAVRIGPALEFSVFPYAESSRRQLTLLYAVSAERFDYEEITIFEETSETRASHTLNVSLDVQETWGEMNVSLEGSHFLRERQQNRVTLRGRVELQIVEGLSLDLSGRASRIRDQIYLPADEASDEEILVGEREFATDFETGIEIGLSFTFGSIFSDVVNPRFESFDGGRRSRF